MLKQKSSVLALVLAFAALGALGCNGASSKPAKLPGQEKVVTDDGQVVNQAAANKFLAGMKKLKKHDEAHDWSDAQCTATAQLFKDADDKQDGNFYRALYNAGIAHQRCKQDQEARQVFEEILSDKPEFHRARVHVALYDYAKDGDIEKAIGQMEKAIADAEFKNEEALVNLAILQMVRDSDAGGNNCENDFACAKLNLQRALAINDSFMPAFNQLAVYYLEKAKKEAGVKRSRRVQAAGDKKKKANTQALELAALVVSQALKKNPKYAPVHNTSGLISAELEDLSAAARAFGTARKLDPKFFEAQMNYAAVNMQFRGFGKAEQAYRQALKLRPNDFEAHLGLALAVRGQINDSNYDKNVAEAEKLLEKAKQIDGSRPETYYNEAILVQEFKARGGGAKQEPVLRKAQGLFQKFTDKAGGDDAYAEAVKRAEERMEEIDQIIEFNKMAAEQKKQMEEMQRQQEAREQLEKGKDK